MKKMMMVVTCFFSMLNFLMAQHNETLKDILDNNKEQQIYFGNPNDKNLNQYFYDFDTDYVSQRKDFKSRFLIEPDPNGAELTSLKMDSISVNLNGGLQTMFDVLQNQMNLPLSLDYFYGLRMYYGLDNDSMIIIFEPVILVSGIKGYRLPRTTISQPSKSYFRADVAGGVYPVDSAKLATYISNFQSPSSRIYINHDKLGLLQKDNHKFLKGKPDRKLKLKLKNNDVQYAFMPLQEIIRVYRDNGGNFENNTDKVLFSFVTNKFRRAKHENYQTKAHIVVSYNFHSEYDLNPDGFRTKKAGLLDYRDNSFTQLAGDATEKCPTNCN